jgi:cytochrome c biogenesis protein CcdA
MELFWLAIVTALWQGILTSISPCPLATNIAAISYIGRKVSQPRLVLSAGLLYTLGRMLAYVVLGALMVAGLLAMSATSQALQKYMYLALGPLLIIVGMFLLELLSFGVHSAGMSERLQARVDRAGIWGAGLLGIIFALTFCPISAALFFLGLIPLAVERHSPFLLPAVFGMGTALPVVVFALLIALGAQQVGRAFNKLSQFELWARRITGAVFILVGIYLTLKYVFLVLG